MVLNASLELFTTTTKSEQIQAANGVHVSLVHFSSPNNRTGITISLDQGVDYASVLQSVNAIDVSSILGISDLDLFVYFVVYKMQ